MMLPSDVTTFLPTIDAICGYPNATSSRRYCVLYVLAINMVGCPFMFGPLLGPFHCVSCAFLPCTHALYNMNPLPTKLWLKQTDVA
jgi:hypothetical protein